MKLATIIGLLSLLAATATQAAVYTFSQTVNSTIPDGNPTGLTSTMQLS